MDEPCRAYLRDRVARSGRSLRALASQAGVHHSTLSRLLAGRQTPTARALVALAGALGLSPADLLVRAGLARDALRLDLTELGVPVILPYALLDAEIERLADMADDPALRPVLTAGYAEKRRGVALGGPVAEHLDRLQAMAVEEGLPEMARRLCRAAVLYFVLGSDRIPDDLFAVGFVDDAWVVERVWRRVGAGRAPAADDER